MLLAVMGMLLVATPEANAQLLKRTKDKVLGVGKKSNKRTKKSKKGNSNSKGETFVTGNQLTSRFGSGFTDLQMLSEEKENKGVTYTKYYFGANDKLAFSLSPRFVYDEGQKTVEGVFSSNFVKEGEQVFHIDELKEVTDQNGTKHSITPTPSLSKRVLKTPDNVYIVYAFDGGKKVGGKYPYFAASSSNFTGPFVIAAPSMEKFNEWSGDKAMEYVKDFENRVKIGSFKFMPKAGKLHTPELAEQSKQAIYKHLKQYKNNANLEIRSIVVYSDDWKEIRDKNTDEVIEQELMAYYVYVNGDDTDLHGAKIIKSGNELVLKKSISDKFSKDIPVSLVDKYFSK